jgi:PST family polysaccharide transporter
MISKSDGRMADTSTRVSRAVSRRAHQPPRAISNYFGENKPLEDFTGRSLRGGVVSLAARAVNALVQVASVIVLARLLSPEDYGLVSMVSAIVGIVPLLIDLGTRDAVIQQPHISRGEVSTLFWMTFTLGCLFAGLVTASGPLIAGFYGEPRLTVVVCVSSLSLFGMSLSYQHQALMRRAMMYQELAIIDIIGNVVATAVAIAMAFRGWAYWSLVVRPVVISVVTTFCVWWKCRWLPGKPAFTNGVKQMLKFGLHWIGFSGVDFAGKFGDRIAIGHTSGALGLGYYQKACLAYDNCLDLVTTPLHSVAMVGLSKLRDNLPELWRSWSKALSTLAFFAMPAFGILAVTSRDVVVLALGQKWETASILLSVLALRGIPHVIDRTVGWLHTAAGRADRFMRWGLISTFAQLVALFAGLPFGTIGVAYSYVVCTFILFLPAIAYSGAPFGIGVGKVLRVVGPQMVGALAASALGFLLRDTAFAKTPMVLRTIYLVASYSVVYLLIVLGLFRVRTPLQVSLSVLQSYAA